MKFYKIAGMFLVISILNACATFKAQYNNASNQATFPDKKIAHSFYFMGDAGVSGKPEASKAIKVFKTALSQASEHSTVVFLGDNIYPKGLPKKGDSGRALAENQLDAQLDAVADFKGETIFIPGNHDWYSNGLKGLKRQEKYIEDALGKNTFLPENGCPIEKVEVSEDIVMIVIDTEWYLTNWDKHPTINDDCEIKTRFKFFEAFESLIKKARGKTTIIAMHHPMFTNGPHGGQYDAKSHLKPIPVLGTLKNVLRKTSGVSPADLQNKRYNAFKKRIVTLAQENKKALLTDMLGMMFLKMDPLWFGFIQPKTIMLFFKRKYFLKMKKIKSEVISNHFQLKKQLLFILKKQLLKVDFINTFGEIVTELIMGPKLLCQPLI